MEGTRRWWYGSLRPTGRPSAADLPRPSRQPPARPKLVQPLAGSVRSAWGTRAGSGLGASNGHLRSGAAYGHLIVSDERIRTCTLRVPQNAIDLGQRGGRGCDRQSNSVAFPVPVALAYTQQVPG